jgi:nitronate monooxygenase
MGAGLSDWRLAQAVSRVGSLGVVSGTGLDEIVSRRLQHGDQGGHIRRVLESFPFPEMAQRILPSHFIPGGKAPDAPYKRSKFHTIDGIRETRELCIIANFVEIMLAREGHDNPVGINYLEKIQLPHLPSLYGAILAGVAVIIIGAGIPLEVPGVLDKLARHEAASYPVYVIGSKEHVRMTFDPKEYWDPGLDIPDYPRPDFLPIVSSESLAKMLHRRSNGEISGFVVEKPIAGGHNAPPRGKMHLSEEGEPIYGPRDVVDIAAIRDLGLPFWLAGGYGTPEMLQAALAEGAAGVQVGTAFALCEESALIDEMRIPLIRQSLKGEANVFTDPTASPAGFPFKVAEIEGTLSDPDVYNKRVRICDLGFLREFYMKDDGSIGFRCQAEPESAYVAKGGQLEDTVGRKCLCNALVANIGLPQLMQDGTWEKCLITLGDDVDCVKKFCTLDNPNYTAADVIRILLG